MNTRLLSLSLSLASVVGCGSGFSSGAEDGGREDVAIPESSTHETGPACALPEPPGSVWSCGDQTCPADTYCILTNDTSNAACLADTSACMTCAVATVAASNWGNCSGGIFGCTNDGFGHLTVTCAVKPGA